MTDLLDLIDARDQRDQGMALALAAEPSAWKERARLAIDQLSRNGRAFSADDVRQIAGDPLHANAMGASLSAAKRAGLIREYGYIQSDRPLRHASRQLLWVGR